MDPTALHEQLADLVPGVLLRDEASLAGLAEVEAHVGAGCSRCARALVNARDAAVVLASAEPAAAPRASLRERLLASARAGPALAARSHAAQKPRRFFDPAGEVARHHIGAPGDDERVREIDELAALVPSADDTSGRILSQVQRVLGFPLAFVSILRGPRSGFRVQRGYDIPGDRRRETSFCTHTISTDGPLVIPNPAAEPFFHGSALVVRDGIRAYAGVPLRTSRGVVVGTLCVMDYTPRFIGQGVVRGLELFTRPIAAEIERARLPAAERWPRTAAGAPLHREAWFRELLHLVTEPLETDRPPSLVIAAGPDAEALADLAREGEPAGRLSGAAVGLLLAGVDPGAAAARFAELRETLLAGAAPGLAVDLVHETDGAGGFANYFR